MTNTEAGSTASRTAPMNASSAIRPWRSWPWPRKERRPDHHGPPLQGDGPGKGLPGVDRDQVALNSGCPTMSVNKHFDLRCGLMYDQTGAGRGGNRA